jgi:hypothetical protein
LPLRYQSPSSSQSSDLVLAGQWKNLSHLAAEMHLSFREVKACCFQAPPSVNPQKKPRLTELQEVIPQGEDKLAVMTAKEGCLDKASAILEDPFLYCQVK